MSARTEHALAHPATDPRQVLDPGLAADEELWNGNVEAPLHEVFTDPEHIVRWSWQGHARYRGLIGDVAARRPQLPIVRVCSRRELTHLIERLSRA